MRHVRIPDTYGTFMRVSLAEQTDLDGKQDVISDLSTIRSGASLGATAVQPDDLATVASTGSYTDLTNKPTIPTVTNTYSATSTNAMSGKAVASAISSAVSSVLKYKGTKTSYSDLPTSGNATGDVWNITNADSTHGVNAGDNVAWTGSAWDVLAGTIDISGKADKADLATVATTGSYTDLSDKPTIPTVNNATLTIQKNGSTVKTFTANASTNATANITVPTKLSELTDDLGTSPTHTHSQYLPLSGGTMTGKVIQKDLTLTDGVNTRTVITAYDDGDSYNYGSELVIGGSGNTYIGGGESAASLYKALGTSTGEVMYVCSDNSIRFDTNCNTIANRKEAVLDGYLNFYPATTSTGSLGTSSYKWASAYINTVTGNLNGEATSAVQDGNGDVITDTYVTKASLPTALSQFTDDLGTSPNHTHSQYLENLNAKYVPSGSVTDDDLNNYTTAGTYIINTSPANSPSGTNGVLVVLTDSQNNLIKQIWSRWGTINSNDYLTYFRTFRGSTWSQWYQIITNKGGTLQGTLVLGDASNSIGITHAYTNTKVWTISSNNAAGHVALNGGNGTYANGASLYLAGDTDANLATVHAYTGWSNLAAGNFALVAGSNSSNNKALIGKQDGTLLWNDKNVLTESNLDFGTWTAE